jgi:hypothetical protein
MPWKSSDIISLSNANRRVSEVKVRFFFLGGGGVMLSCIKLPVMVCSTECHFYRHSQQYYANHSQELIAQLSPM